MELGVREPVRRRSLDLDLGEAGRGHERCTAVESNLKVEAMMTVRSLLLWVLVIGVLFGHVRESHAITSCNVCADEAHPCDFPCSLGSPPHQIKTTCKSAGYQCLRVQDLATDDACRAPTSTVDAQVALDVVTLADAWLHDVLALVTGIVERVASLDRHAGARLASR